MERDNRKDKFRKALNVLLAIAVFGAWGWDGCFER